VANSQIIAMKVNNDDLEGDNPFTAFAWTVDGETVKPVDIKKTRNNERYEKCIDYANNIQSDIEECERAENDEIGLFYLPITGNNGDKHTITATATKKDGTTIDLIKVLTVADPVVQINSVDEKARPILLGYYVDSNKNKWPDYSSDSFITNQGNEVTLQAASNVDISSGGDNFQYSWYLDSSPLDLVKAEDGTISLTEDSQAIAEAKGISIDSKNGNISFSIDKDVNSYYDISFAGTYKPSSANQKALYKYWGITASDVAAKDVGSSITMKVLKKLDTTTGGLFKNKILATIFTGFPLYLFFLFKIVITISLLLFSSWLLFNLMPNIRREEEYYL